MGLQVADVGEPSDRLSATDASFLALEGPSTHMHMGAVVLLDGPPPSFERFAELLAVRVGRVARFRQKLVFPPLRIARPIWVEDRAFALGNHLQRVALAAPGSVNQLKQLAGERFSEQLDRTRPLWQCYFVEQLSDDRFALIWKLHHCMTDGISAANLLAVIFDAETPQSNGRQPVHAPADPAGTSVRRAQPTKIALLTAALRFYGLRLGLVARRATRAIGHPARAIATVAQAVRGLAEAARVLIRQPAPSSPLNCGPGPRRAVDWLSFPLADLKEIKATASVTMNDAYLAIVAGAMQGFYRFRGEPTDGVELQAMVPVTLRPADDRDELGNRTAMMRGPLPLAVDDPQERLGVIRTRMAAIKDSPQVTGARVMIGLNDLLPPPLLALSSRLNFSTRLFNLIVSNIPGPAQPVHVLGRQVWEFVPLVCLPEGHTVSIVLLTYHDTATIGFLADADRLPDLHELVEQTRVALAELRPVEGDRRLPEHEHERPRPRTPESTEP